MARKKSTKPTEPVQPEVQPEVVSEKSVQGETQPPAPEEQVWNPVVEQAEVGETLPPAPDNYPAEGAFVPPIEEKGEPQPAADVINLDDIGTTGIPSPDEVQLEMVIVPELDAPETNTVTNLPLQEGEERYTVTRGDLERNPDLAEQGVEEGAEIILGPVMSAEDIVLAAIDCRDEYVEITPTLELLVNNPEDQQENRFIKKLLTGMIAEGQIEVQNQVHLLLGSAYYKPGDPVTRYQTLRTVPVYAKKRS